ncbi:MAG: hypothetical protein CME65_10920 [Halobacteriovoraceae bacterium]|nr:hypothetical protein [Halobacteriovoraceae bacterium]
MLNLRQMACSAILCVLCFASLNTQANNIVMETYEQTCNNQMTCSKKESGYFGPRTYYAIGLGTDRESALAESDIVFEEAFGNMDSCGLFNGPTSIGCGTFTNGMMACVRRCINRNRRSGRGSSRPRCVNIGGVLHCP